MISWKYFTVKRKQMNTKERKEMRIDYCCLKEKVVIQDMIQKIADGTINEIVFCVIIIKKGSFCSGC